ncbi:MAG: 16S rRNA (cytidine(1402)-2'-O)-methyltransferase [Erysipelotrichaceae bacterium]
MQRQKSFDNDNPTLYLVATPIGNLEEFTPRAIKVLQSVDLIAAEDTRNTMKLLSHFEIKNKMVAHHSHNERESAKGLLNLLEQGKSIAIVSDAGYPLVSDPGQTLVKLVVEAGFNVVPISGSNAMLNALVASGISSQPFVFYGFLGHSEKERVKQLTHLKYYPETLIFYESPHRISKFLQSCLNILGDREVCIARELTKRHEEFIRGTISELLEISDQLKGEMVVIVAGSEEERTPDIALPLIGDQIQTYISQGLSTNEAIKRVAKERNISKNEIYKQYHS